MAQASTPSMLLPVLISGPQSTPKKPTIRVANTNPNNPVACQVPPSAQRHQQCSSCCWSGRWRGGVSFPVAKRWIRPVAFYYVSPLSGARPNMIRTAAYNSLGLVTDRRQVEFITSMGDPALALYGILRRPLMMREEC
ncbi:hypothetical protein V8C42DRAFT_311384 [Trichoderma barbatum]